jgi:hypothetical protein
MNRSACSLFVLSVIAATAITACYTGGSVDAPAPAAGAGNVSTAGFDITGLPCDVAQMLANSCASCHGIPLSGGAPNELTSYAQLMAPSRTDPTLTVAQLSVQRMKDTKTPMPPGGAAAADLAVLEGWLTAGTPAGTCTTTVAGNGVYNGPTVCTSGSYSTRGNGGGMRPGEACINCHAQGEGPRFAIAGTVYPTAHEPDDCVGSPSSAGISVVVTDATGAVTTLKVSSSGNFYSSGRGRITPPYTAKVVSGGKTRVMVSAQTNGDCNACHTVGGTSGAPGRIVAP